MWKEAVMAYFALARNRPAGTEESKNSLSSGLRVEKLTSKPLLFFIF